MKFGNPNVPAGTEQVARPDDRSHEVLRVDSARLLLCADTVSPDQKKQIWKLVFQFEFCLILQCY